MEKSDLKKCGVLWKGGAGKCVAAMDLGTNSSRLLIADEAGNPVCRDVKNVALGEGLAINGCFCKQAMERAFCSFMDFQAMMDVYNVARYRAIATAACRMSANRAEFISEVERVSGISVEVIDEYEEARLTLKGAALNADKSKKYLLVYDLGGGSTEVTLALNGETPKILHTVSIPFGARNATEFFSLKNYDAARAFRLKTAVLEHLRPFLAEIEPYQPYDDACLVATSSTPLRLAAMIAGQGVYDKFQVDGATLMTDVLDETIGRILQMPMEERYANVYIGKSRAEIFVAACVIFQTIYQNLKQKEMTASLKGAQEAIITELKA